MNPVGAIFAAAAVLITSSAHVDAKEEPFLLEEATIDDVQAA
jgi:hypothetical protein